jgi:twitching motility protein PilT
MLSLNIAERRKSFRAYCDIVLKCEIIDPKDYSIRYKNAMARNISADGIYFELDELLPLGIAVNIAFRLPQSENDIRGTVKVMRVEIHETDKKFGIGAIFTSMVEKEKEQIRQLVERLNINKLLEATIKTGASDLHLLAGRTPFIRSFGEIQPLNWQKLSAQDISHLLYSIMAKQQIINFEKNKELDFAIQYDMHNRFRVNVHQQKGFTEATLRLINTKISSFEELNLPEVVKELAGLRDGLIIIAGPTGSGKTTTIAAMVDYINRQRKAVIITLERPIEYVYPDDKSIIKQREVGIDTHSFSAALKSTLRQDPNVIVVGELDDIETIRTAIIAAEAGHLVIASFHAPNTIQAIDRLVNIFPAETRKQTLSQISHCIRGIVTQLLIPKKDKKARALVTEILVATDAAKRVIRSDELIQIPTIIQTGAAHKMQSMCESIKRCFDQNIIDSETANFYSEEFSKYTR